MLSPTLHGWGAEAQRACGYWCDANRHRHAQAGINQASLGASSGATCYVIPAGSLGAYSAADAHETALSLLSVPELGRVILAQACLGMV